MNRSLQGPIGNERKVSNAKIVFFTMKKKGDKSDARGALGAPSREVEIRLFLLTSTSVWRCGEVRGGLGAGCLPLFPGVEFSLIEVKSRIYPQIHAAGRQVGAIKQVRRAGWEWAASLLRQRRASRAAECTCAGARLSTFPLSLLRGLPQSCLPHAPQSPLRSATSRSA